MILRAICPVRKPLVLRMSLQDVEALGYAVITNMRGCASDKAIHVLGVPAAERAAQRRAEQATDPRQGRARPQVDNVRAPYPRFVRPKHYGRTACSRSPDSSLKSGRSE